MLSFDPHWRPGDQGVRRIGNDLICGLEPRHHLDGIAVIAADRDRDQLRLAIPHDPDLQTLRLEDQRIGRNRDGAHLIGQREIEMHHHVGARHQVATGIIDIDFGQQRARCQIDRVGVPHERAVKDLAREGIEPEGGGRTGRAARA